jgi:hypothetical protein
MSTSCRVGVLEGGSGTDFSGGLHADTQVSIRLGVVHYSHARRLHTFPASKTMDGALHVIMCRMFHSELPASQAFTKDKRFT